MRLIGLAVVLALNLILAPLAAGAQAGKVARIGYLSLGAAVPPGIFVERLRGGGYVEGQNVKIDYRFGEGKHDVMGALAAELVGLNVDVIIAVGDEAIVAAKKTTTIIPIVMLACDALAVGFVNSLARPEGNVTGVTCVTTELSPKRVALLREAVPKVSRVGLLFNPANVAKPFDADQTRRVAQGMGLKIQSQEVLEPSDLERAFSALARERADALIVLDEAWTLLHARRVAELAIKHRLATMHSFREAAVAGGLMSYGPSLGEMLSISATYFEKILKGAKPGDLPVEQPTKFELVINLKTAKALGLTMPQSLLVRADEIIQ
jgi:putative ABC transport system substrate-binding protein